MLARITLMMIFSLAALNAGIDRNVTLRPVHEAFVTKIEAPLPVELVAKKPPELKAETPPPQPAANLIWIPGYWAWDRNVADFTWICGVWRLPPPDRQWVAGFWQESKGWYWVGGYWKGSSESFTISAIAPPNTPEENPGNAPNQNYFYAPGYWSYNSSSKNYSWLAGSWQMFDAQWVFTPACWQWRPEGYLFHPAFWDWTLEKRGVSFNCTGPTLVPVSPEVVLSCIYYYYPTYVFVFWHHWHFFPGFWADCWCSPPWWGWGGWWTLSWHNQWALFWWWGHPGFPAPFWLSLELSGMISAPDALFLEFFGAVPHPFFITSFGMLDNMMWLKAIEKISKEKGPLLSDKLWDEVTKEAGKEIKKRDPLRPTGKKPIKDLPKPIIDQPPTAAGKGLIPTIPLTVPQTAPLPTKPAVTQPAVTQPQVIQTPQTTPQTVPQRTQPVTPYYPPQEKVRELQPIFIPQQDYDKPRRRQHEQDKPKESTKPKETKPLRTPSKQSDTQKSSGK